MIAIHVGFSKAGSSTIQNFFAKNRKDLLYLNIDYPSVGLSKNNHHNFAQEVLAPSKFDPAVGTVNDLRIYRRISQKPIIFISSEVFCFFDTDNVSTLKQSLASIDRSRMILLVVRDHVERMPSSYAQKIKYGRHNYNFDKFFRLAIGDSRLNYYKVAKRWADAFDWSNLSVKALDRRCLINGDLIDDILYTLGVNLEAQQATKLDRTEIRNISPGWRVLESFRALYNGTHGLPKTHPILRSMEENGREIDLGALAIRVGADIGWNDDRGLYLTRKQAQQCLDLYRENVNALNEHLLEKLPMPLSLEERGFKERTFLPSVEQIPRADLIAFYDQLAERWFDFHRQLGKRPKR